MLDKIQDREELVRRAQRLTTEMQLRAESVETDLRKSHQIRAQELTRRLSALEIELAEEKNARKVFEYESKQTVSELSTELEVQRSELTRITREKDVLHEKVRDFEGKYENEKRTLVQNRKETSATILNLDKTIKEYKNNIIDLEARILQAKKNELENQFASQMLVANMDSQKIEKAAMIEAMQRETQSRASELEKMYVDKLEKIKENTRDALDKVRKNKK